ncbi:MAG: PQQ-binding-like beta-propeller repeat protein [Parvibaculaceae bacterium]
MRCGLRLIPILLSTAMLLAGCSSAEKLLGGITGEKDVVLPGKRESILSSGGDDLAIDKSNEPIVIPAAETNPSWPQPGGSATNALGNLALGGSLSRAWSATAGEGSTKEQRLVASPIVVGGAIYVLDATNRISAISTSGGKQLWRVSLAPEKKSDSLAFGGGLASDGRNIYATSVFGDAIALDASSGKPVWRKKMGTPLRAAPTVSDGVVFFTGSGNAVYALRTSDGNELWNYKGTGGGTSVSGSPSPAVGSGFVVIPSTTGEVSAYTANDGLQSWSDALSAIDPGSSAANIGAIAGRPVIDGGQVFAISNSGKMGAFDLSTGERQWTRDISGTQTPWVAGDYVFVIAHGKNLMALSRRTGGVRWSVELPGKQWAGPVLGGGRLLMVSDEGKLASVSAQTGQIVGTTDIGDKLYVAPIIANGTVYLLTDSATLIAMR